MAEKPIKPTKRISTWLVENAGKLSDDFELHPSTHPVRREAFPNLGDAVERKRLTHAALRTFLNLVGTWRLTDAEARAIAGISAQRTWRQIKNGEWRGALSQDQLTRLSAIFGIYGALHLLYSDKLADAWLRRANTGPLFRGLTPLDVLIRDGIPAFVETRRHLDALCVGN